MPSINRAIAQKMIQAARPTTKSNPLEISIGKFVKGKQKIGNKTTTKNNDTKDNLSNMFELFMKLLYQ